MHSLCTFSSTLQVALGSGFQNGLPAKNKAVDIVFIIDGSYSMTGYDFNVEGVGPIQKYLGAIDLIEKMVTAYDDYQMPGTMSYNKFDAPKISTDIKSIFCF